jgi:photosynthetic reaction center H subunit
MKDDRNLVRLRDFSGYEVADGDPDVRGWEVFTLDGIRFGVVDELIVDTGKMKVRYLDIEIDPDIEGVTDDRHLLVPVGAASIDEKDDIVHIRTIETITLLKTPPYSGALSRDYEDQLREHYYPEKRTVTRDPEKDYYDEDWYDEEKFYRARRRKL